MVDGREIRDRDDVAHQEARALARGGGVGEHVAADGDVGRAVGAAALRAAVGEEARVADAEIGDAVAGGRAGEAGEHERGVVVAAADRAEVEQERLRRVRAQLDATGAVLGIEGRDAFGDRRGGGTA